MFSLQVDGPYQVDPHKVKYEIFSLERMRHISVSVKRLRPPEYLNT